MKDPGDDRRSRSLLAFGEPSYPEVSMPRLPMTEEEKNARIIIDAKNKYLLESHIPTIIWSRSQMGFRIQDLYDRQYFDVTNLIQICMPADPLMKTITDPETIDVYLSKLMDWYPKTQSLVAIKEGSKEVIGVLLGRLVIEDDWFNSLSEITFVTKKDKYAYLKKGVVEQVGETEKAVKTKHGQRKSMGAGSQRASKQSRRASKRASRAPKGGGSRKSMKGDSRKSLGAKGGSRKSMGAKGGSRKSMGAKGGSRKSMGAKGGSRKSMGGGSRKSMGGGSRKSMGGGSRKSMTGRSKGRTAAGKRTESRKGETKVPRPIDIVPEEEISVFQAAVFDDDGVIFTHKELQYVQAFKKRLADKFMIWKLLNHKIYYNVYHAAVSPKYERFDVYQALFMSLKHMCAAFNVPVIAGVLTTYASQNAFYDIGGLIVYEVLYKYYPRFAPSDQECYDQSAAAMILELTPPVQPESQRRGSKSRKSKG